MTAADAVATMLVGALCAVAEAVGAIDDALDLERRALIITRAQWIERQWDALFVEGDEGTWFDFGMALAVCCELEEIVRMATRTAEECGRPGTALATASCLAAAVHQRVLEELRAAHRRRCAAAG